MTTESARFCNQYARTHNAQQFRIDYGDGKHYNLMNEKDLQDFLLDISDGNLNGECGAGAVNRENGNMEVYRATMKNGVLTLPNGKTYDFKDPRAVQRFKQDALDGKIDHIITRNHGGSPPATHSEGPSDTHETVNEPPAPKENGDLAKWMDFVKENGVDAYLEALKNGQVPKEVQENQGFQLMLQREQQSENRYWQTMTTMEANKHQTLKAIIANLRV